LIRLCFNRSVAIVDFTVFCVTRLVDLAVTSSQYVVLIVFNPQRDVKKRVKGGPFRRRRTTVNSKVGFVDTIA